MLDQFKTMTSARVTALTMIALLLVCLAGQGQARRVQASKKLLHVTAAAERKTTISAASKSHSQQASANATSNQLEALGKLVVFCNPSVAFEVCGRGGNPPLDRRAYLHSRPVDFRHRAQAARLQKQGPVKQLMVLVTQNALRDQSDLAQRLKNKGDFKGAKEMYRQVLDARTSILGSDHPDVLLSKIHLASTMQALGDLKGAVEVMREVFECRSRVLGPDHPDTLASKESLAKLLPLATEIGTSEPIVAGSSETITRGLGSFRALLAILRQSVRSNAANEAEPVALASALKDFNPFAFFDIEAGEPQYPFDPRIHNFGNHGFLGMLHAKIAPVFTTTVDKNLYGFNVRQHIVDMQGPCKTVLDFGCGTGFSTSAYNGSLGVDTSIEMLKEASRQFPGKMFEHGHAEFYEPARSFDVVTCMFLMHEVPQASRKRIIENACRIAKERVVVADIAPDYTPSQAMLAGEPYLLDYISNIRDDLSEFDEMVLVPGHVRVWSLNKSITDTSGELPSMTPSRKGA
mmetsp:Transcript_146049/g.266120  ORF Transcript_146049/g.266120 Transcript_146049/m.266120 type:complete len:519 (+) Transcript_146049:30-1586(+)